LSNSDGVTNLNAGANTTYAIVVTNPATVAVSGVSLSDTFPAGLSACTWTCSASAGRHLPERQRQRQYRDDDEHDRGQQRHAELQCDLHAVGHGDRISREHREHELRQ
jgi:uncharacterized repeat protein (TIGR01451 family)